MSLNPLNELKRRLEDNDTPLPKRLCLAKNVINSHHFPSAPKERIVGAWLQDLTLKNKLTGDDLKNLASWFNNNEDFTSELKIKFVQIVSLYLQRNPLNKEDVPSIFSLLENSELSTQFSQHIEESLLITISLLEFLKTENNPELSRKVFRYIIKFYKESKKKLEFIVKLLDGENLETVFSYLDTDSETVVNVCESILFPTNKKSFFASYLQTLVRKDSINELIAEKGDNIQSVLKIMDVFFGFPKGRTFTKPKFLSDFIDVFVSCYKSESQLIFAFFVMATNCLNIEQKYITPAMNMDIIIPSDENSEKIKRNIFLNMLLSVLRNEVDINVRLSDTLGVKIPKVETKKTFLQFLGSVLTGQLKLEGKPDKNTFEILKVALKLDPSLIESRINEILPKLLVSKKSSSVIDSYTEMFKYLMETLFKLSRGTTFLNEILPHIKLCIEAGYTEQSKEKHSKKPKNRTITGNDIFPYEIVELFGKLSSELMFRQNNDLLLSLQKDLVNLGLEDLNRDNVCPSSVIMTEVISAILSAFFKYNKMADHTVPSNIAEEFWNTFQYFESKVLRKFGEVVINIEPQLIKSFLSLCINFSTLKLLKLKYGNTETENSIENYSTDVFDLSLILPCLTPEEWSLLSSKIEDDEVTLLLDEILVLKTLALETVSARNTSTISEAIAVTKTHMIKEMPEHHQLLDPNKYFAAVLLTNLDKSQLKQSSKAIIKQVLAESNVELLNQTAICNNTQLLNVLLLETIKNILKYFENAESLAKAVGKKDFDFVHFGRETDMSEYFNQLNVTDAKEDDILTDLVEILKHLKIYYLVETYQLLAIFVLLAIKKNCHKKLRRNVDHIMQSIFELSAQPPDLYKIFPVKYIFCFESKVMIDLLTLKIKTQNNLLVIKSLVESAVKRVKVESDLVKSIVELLLSKQSKINCTDIELFSDPAFQISCLILPLIVKQKKVITLSAYRSILADLQEKLHISILQCFKNINFDGNKSIVEKPGNTDDSMVVSESTIATLNALSAYSLTLSKYCESSDEAEYKNLDYLWNGLEYFTNNAINAIQNSESKYQHVEYSIQLLNSVLRYIKKLESHQIFGTKDKFLVSIWNSVKARLAIEFEAKAHKKARRTVPLEDIALTVKFLCEWVSVEGFIKHIVGALSSLQQLEAPSKLIRNETLSKSVLTSQEVARFLWINVLKANIIGPKCVAITKLIYQNSRNLKSYIQQNYECDDTGVILRSKKKKIIVEYQDIELADLDVKDVKIDDVICDIVKANLEIISDAILAAKKVNVDYKFLDSVFELHQSIQYILGRSVLHLRCSVSWDSFFKLFKAAVTILNSLLVSREELLEDRWPCYMQCYRVLISCLCKKSSSQEQLDRSTEEKLEELAHSIEKLTQSICKRKSHVSRIAAYSVADICSSLEQCVVSRNVRQHLENSIALLIQVSDTAHAMAFLRRALAGNPGQMTMTNMYTVFKRYHKYVGNS